MITELLHSVRQSVSVRRVSKAFVVTAMCILLVASMAPVTPVAAQEGNETSPCSEGPPVPPQDTAGTSGDPSILFVNDNSNAMFNEMDDGRTRMEALKESVIGFIEASDEATRYGHVSNSPPDLKHQLDTDHATMIDSVEALGFEGAGNQDDATALELAADQFDDSDQKVMIFATDGVAYSQEAVTAADEIRANGTTIYTVGFGDNQHSSYLTDLAGDADRYYSATSGDDVDDIYEDISQDVGVVGGDLRIETRSLFQPGETHPYTVTNETVYDNGTVVTEDVTDEASVNTTNSTLLSANESGHTLSATDDANASTWVRVDASHGNTTGCVNAIVAEASMENLELLPPVWRFGTFLGDWTIFFFVISIGAGIVGTRVATSFMGLSMMELVLVMGWFGGYISTGLVLTSVFACLFIGLNLAANIDYQVTR